MMPPNDVAVRLQKPRVRWKFFSWATRSATPPPAVGGPVSIVEDRGAPRKARGAKARGAKRFAGP
jgi:hypothetical protein